MSYPPAWLGVVSADAILSDIRPTTVHPVALEHVNLFVDEVFASLIAHAESLNPRDLRMDGVPAVFSSSKNESTGTRALGRSAVAEAEVELRGFYEGKRKGRPFGNGNGMRQGDAPLAVKEATDIVRIRASTLCTLCPDDAYPRGADEAAMAAWKAVGGDPEAVEPAMLWLIAVVEHLIEQVLSALSRVVARDSSQSVAGPSELYTTLCEDASLWGLFKKMRVKDALEEAMRTAATRSKRSVGPTSPAAEKRAGRVTPANGSPHIGTSTPPREASMDVGGQSAPPPSSFDTRTSIEHRAAPSQAVHKTASITRRMLGRDKEGTHERTNSVLSVNTKAMIGAYQDSVSGSGNRTLRSPQENSEDFDALILSGETMKVSLTPSRLKTFDTGRKSQTGSPNQPTFNRSGAPPLPSDELPIPRRGNINGVGSPSLSGDPGNRSRSASQARLTARGATTIEENDEEDDLPGARRGKKETLAEMFAGEPDATSSQGGRRTVPAVVLGIPPPAAESPAADNYTLPLPPRAAQRQQSNPSLNRPQGRMIPSDDADHNDFGGRTMPRRRTEAQELADFLSFTAPPSPSNPLSPLGNDGVKTKGLKGFMSKLAGGRQPAQSKVPKVEDIPTINPALVAAKRKQSAMVGGASPASARTRLPSSSSAPDVEADRKPNALRKRSDGKDTMGSAQSVPRNLSEASQGGFSNRDLARDSAPTDDTKLAAAATAGALGLAGAGAAALAVVDNQTDLKRKISKRKAVPRDAADASPKDPAASKTIVENEPDAPAPAAQEVQNDATPEAAAATAVAPTSAAQNALRGSTSDVNSFMTADEGVTRETSGQSAAPISKDAPPAAAPAVPSIALADLAPLRKLLDHATSARECQLLLNAVLSQWGVPASAEDDLSPEDRVAAWLLAGREGPTGLTTSTTTDSALSKGETEVLRTPTQLTDATLEAEPVAHVGGKMMPGGLGHIGGQSTPAVASAAD